VDFSSFSSNQGGKVDLIKESQRRRGENIDIVDKIVELDEKHRGLIFKLNQKEKEKKVKKVKKFKEKIVEEDIKIEEEKN